MAFLFFFFLCSGLVLETITAGRISLCFSLRYTVWYPLMFTFFWTGFFHLTWISLTTIHMINIFASSGCKHRDGSCEWTSTLLHSSLHCQKGRGWCQMYSQRFSCLLIWTGLLDWLCYWLNSNNWLDHYCLGYQWVRLTLVNSVVPDVQVKMLCFFITTLLNCFSFHL